MLAALYTPGFMNILTRLVYPDEAAVRSLDPALLLDGRLDLSNDLLLTCIMGAVLVGVGQGLVVRQQSHDEAAQTSWSMLLQKYAGIKFSTGILLADGAVVLSGLVVIGFGLGTDQPAEGRLDADALFAHHDLRRIARGGLHARRCVVRQAALHHQRQARHAQGVHHPRPGSQRHLY